MNPALKKLGFGPTDRVVIIHADDIGMCQATLPAYADLLEFGLLSSAAVMVPCPWFAQAAAFCADHPAVDMGVHLTLNAEWAPYRWGPISTRDPATGLLDAQGYFHSGSDAVEAQADPGAVAVELRAQIARAQEAGIDLTHVDTHMGTLIRPPFLQAYVDVALENRLPLLFVRAGEEDPQRRGFMLDLPAHGLQLSRELEERGYPLFDDVGALPLDQDPSDQLARAQQVIDDLQPGLTMLILHPSVDTPELRAIAPDWPSRAGNYAVCRNPAWRDHIRQAGVQVIGYRPLRELIRAQP